MNRIAVIGNGGGGKTTLSRAIAERYNLPLTHVDSIQYLAGMKVRPTDETRTILNEIANSPKWLIDGFGLIDVMENRFGKADKIIFVDLPLWRHYWWCTKRQVQSIWAPRSELPDGCNEATITHTTRLYKILWKVHFKIRPQLQTIFKTPPIKSKVTRITNLDEWNSVFYNGFQ